LSADLQFVPKHAFRANLFQRPVDREKSLVSQIKFKKNQTFFGPHFVISNTYVLGSHKMKHRGPWYPRGHVL